MQGDSVLRPERAGRGNNTLNGDTQSQIGETAANIWHVLRRDGTQSLAQLKTKVGNSDELLQLALQWLEREDKIELMREEGGLRVRLK